jgi:hypothetical protein
MGTVPMPTTGSRRALLHAARSAPSHIVAEGLPREVPRALVALVRGVDLATKGQQVASVAAACTAGVASHAQDAAGCEAQWCAACAVRCGMAWYGERVDWEVRESGGVV